MNVLIAVLAAASILAVVGGTANLVRMTREADRHERAAKSS